MTGGAVDKGGASSVTSGVSGAAGVSNPDSTVSSTLGSANVVDPALGGLPA